MRVITKKTSAGHFMVIVIHEYEELGRFYTTDMQLIDDINETNENELMMHDCYADVIDTCLQKCKL